MNFRLTLIFSVTRRLVSRSLFYFDLLHLQIDFHLIRIDCASNSIILSTDSRKDRRENCVGTHCRYHLAHSSAIRVGR